VNDSRLAEFSPPIVEGFSTVVSLHAHTCHSRESLGFLPAFVSTLPRLARILERQAARYREHYGEALDFERTYWRPPLSPAAVLDSETIRATRVLHRPVIVSITDHDTIDGGLALHALGLAREVPLSFEWTINFHAACFHVGAHNLPPPEATAIMRECAATTKTADPARAAEVLTWLQELPQTLVVLNHPFWDGNAVGDQQRDLLTAWLDRYGHLVDALEVNGYRAWAENRKVIALSERCRLPFVGGGDRHARAPSAILNVTRARTFGEFAQEVRLHRRSRVVVMPEYRRPRLVRTIEAVAEVLRSDPSLPFGERWIDRVFHESGEHGDRPVSHYWEDREPFWLRCAVGAACVAGGRGMTIARRLAASALQGLTP
jgi:hypothetical protein